MKGLGKKVVALAAVAALAMTSLIGCGKAESVDNNEVALVVSGTEVTAGVANFYIRYQQSAVESMYASMLGDDMWKLQMSEDSDETYEDSTKESIVEDLKEMYVLKAHAADFNVSLTEEELSAIEAAADAFVVANDAEVLAKVSGEKEIVVEVLSLLALSDKMYDAMIADVSTEVTDEEAAQKKMAYMSFSKTTTDDSGVSVELTEDELADVKKEAEDFLTEAKSAGNLEAYAETQSQTASTLTFDAETTSLDTAVITAADALEENAFADLIETDDAYYVVQLTSAFDEEATATEKENIVITRQNEEYNTKLESFLEEAEVTVNQEVIDKISLHNLAVTAKVEEEETEE